MKTGFVFTNYNSSIYTKELITSLNPFCSEYGFPIVIVDNNSDEMNVKELQVLKNEFPNIYLILSDTNHGYFKGLNVGIKYITDNFKDINYLIIGNNDLIFPEDFIDKLKNKVELFNQYPVISPNIITDNGIYQNPHVIKKISFFRELVYDVYFSNYFLAGMIKSIAKLTRRFTDRDDESSHEIAQPIYQGHGSCYILGPLFLKNFIELFAPTFLMGEEFFLSIQLKTKNYQIFYEPSIKIIHQCHSSLDKIPSKRIWQIAKESHKEYRKYITIKSYYNFSSKKSAPFS